MKPRTSSYLGTFVNSPEGLSSYKLMVKNVRNTVTGGRFVKMFRGNSRKCDKISFQGKTWSTRSGCSRKEGATHFDVYLLSRIHHTENNYGWSHPKFFNFSLV